MVSRVARQPSLPAAVGVDDVDVGLARPPTKANFCPSGDQASPCQTSRVSTRFPLPSAFMT